MSFCACEQSFEADAAEAAGPDPGRPIGASGDDELPVRAERGAPHDVAVAAERLQAAAAGDVPDPRRPIGAGGDDELPVRAERGALNGEAVAAERLQTPAARDVPDPGRPI